MHKGFSSKGKAAFNQAHNINQVNCAIKCGSDFRNGCYSRFGSSKRSISSMTLILSWFEQKKNVDAQVMEKENVFEYKAYFL